MSEVVDFYAMKLTPPPAAGAAGVIGGAMFAFFLRSYPIQEEAIGVFLASQGWVEVSGTRQQLVLSRALTETIAHNLRPGVLEELQERGFAMRIFQHSEDDGEFDLKRILQ